MQVAPDDTLARVPREAARPGVRLLPRALRKVHGRGAVRFHHAVRRLAAVLRLQRHVRTRERLAKYRRVLCPLLMGIGLWICQRRERALPERTLYCGLLLQHRPLLHEIDVHHGRNLIPQLFCGQFVVSTDGAVALFVRPLAQLPELTTRGASDGIVLQLEVALLSLPVRERETSIPRAERKRRQPLRPVQAQLPAHLLRRVELHAADPGEHGLPPLPQTLLEAFDVPRAQPREERASHRVQAPQVDVRMDAAAPLRLHGSEERADEPERSTRPRGGHAVGDARGPALRRDADDMLQEQFQHEVRDHGLRHRVSGHPPQHVPR